MAEVAICEMRRLSAHASSESSESEKLRVLSKTSLEVLAVALLPNRMSDGMSDSSVGSAGRAEGGRLFTLASNWFTISAAVGSAPASATQM